MKLSYLFSGNSRGAGIFTLPTGEEGRGQIRLDHGQDCIILQINTDVAPPKPHRSIIHGWVNQGDKVTLIGYPPTLSAFVQPMPPHVIKCDQLLTGISHFKSDKHRIAQTRFKLSGSSQIFPNYVSWVTRRNCQEILNAIIGESFSPADPDESFNRVLYSSGPMEIFSCETERYGRMSVYKSDVVQLPSEGFLRVDVKFAIEHPPNTDLRDVENAIQCVTRFFWLITGTRQYAENIQITVNTPEDDTVQHFDAYFPLQEAPLSERKDRDQTNFHSLLINPNESRGEIEECLRNWVELYSERKRVACDIVLNQFFDHRHPPHRIALATAAFEWFWEPSPGVRNADMPKLTKTIVKFAKKKIEDKFPRQSPERKKVLRKLSQILSPPKGNPKLKDMIASRLKRISPAISDEMKEIDEVFRDAVDLRHRFIHGGKKQLVRDHGISRMFLAQTLEFIFLASVLEECGWNMKSWNERESRTFDHPLDRFVLHWKQFCDIWCNEKSSSAR